MHRHVLNDVDKMTDNRSMWCSLCLQSSPLAHTSSPYMRHMYVAVTNGVYRHICAWQLSLIHTILLCWLACFAHWERKCALEVPSIQCWSHEYWYCTTPMRTSMQHWRTACIVIFAYNNCRELHSSWCDGLAGQVRTHKERECALGRFYISSTEVINIVPHMGASEAPSHCNCDMNLMKSDGCQLSVNPAVRRFTIDGPHSNELWFFQWRRNSVWPTGLV